MSDLAEQIKQAELDKLRAETGKLRNEAKNELRAQRIGFWSEVAKFFGAIIIGLGGFMAALTQYQIAEQKALLAEQTLVRSGEKLAAIKSELSETEEGLIKTKEKKAIAESELKEAKEATETYKAELSKLVTKAKSTNPTIVPDQLVYVQFRGSISRELVNAYRSELKAHSYNAPGAERLSGDYGNSVRFFSEEGRAEATRVANLTEQFFQSKGCPINISPKRVVLDTTPSHVEVWFHHSC